MRRLSILCTLGIVFGVALCSFSISTKEKIEHVKCEVPDLFVPHEAFDIPYGGELPGMDMEVLSDEAIFFVEVTQNDTYLARSEKWIRDRNYCVTVRESAKRDLFDVRLNC